MTAPKNKTRLAHILIAIIVLACVAFLLWRELGWDPRFDQSRLLGLSPTQVVNQFGTPYFDPRTVGAWTNQAQDGDLVLGYVGPWGQTYSIEFKNAAVISVRRSMK